MNLSLSDDALWARIRRDDADAFGLLFERHGRAIYNYCFRRTGDWTNAKDLASVVFLEAWRHRHRELEPDKVLPWLYGVATNVVRNRRRSVRRHSAALARLPRPQASPDFADEVLDRLDDAEKMARLLVVFRGLPKRQQDVLALCDWSGLSHAAAATALGLPLGTVKSTHFRARHRLQELLTASGHELEERTMNEEAASDAS